MSETETSPITVRAVEAAYGQAWRLDIEATGEDHRGGAYGGDFIESQRRDAGEGHIGTRLAVLADHEARREAAAEAGWNRFMRLANLRNLELAGKATLKDFGK
jgi:hypothetical protein